MDDVSSLADRSNDFISFLGVTRKFKFKGVYVFHIICPSNLNWQMIILQTKIFNIFPRSIKVFSISKILSTKFNRHTFDYITNRSLCLNRLYFQILFFNKKDCLKIDYTLIQYGSQNIGLVPRMIISMFLSMRKQSADNIIIFEI